MPRHSYLSRLRLMLKLPVASSLANQLPAVRFDELEDVTDLHRPCPSGDTRVGRARLRRHLVGVSPTRPGCTCEGSPPSLGATAPASQPGPTSRFAARLYVY